MLKEQFELAEKLESTEPQKSAQIYTQIIFKNGKNLNFFFILKNSIDLDVFCSFEF